MAFVFAGRNLKKQPLRVLFGAAERLLHRREAPQRHRVVHLHHPLLHKTKLFDRSGPRVSRLQRKQRRFGRHLLLLVQVCLKFADVMLRLPFSALDTRDGARDFGVSESNVALVHLFAVLVLLVDRGLFFAQRLVF